MALKYFKGRIDLAKLSLSDLAEAASALAALERLASNGVIQFETGASRNAGPRPDMLGGRELARPRLQKEILAVLSGSDGLTFNQILVATGMKDGSLSANLTALVREGVISKEIDRSSDRKVGRPPRSETKYRLLNQSDSQEII